MLNVTRFYILTRTSTRNAHTHARIILSKSTNLPLGYVGRIVKKRCLEQGWPTNSQEVHKIR